MDKTQAILLGQLYEVRFSEPIKIVRRLMEMRLADLREYNDTAGTPQISLNQGGISEIKLFLSWLDKGLPSFKKELEK